LTTGSGVPTRQRCRCWCVVSCHGAVGSGAVEVGIVTAAT
jgi:hypothetical protein